MLQDICAIPCKLQKMLQAIGNVILVYTFPINSEDFNVIDSKYIKKSAIHMIPVFNFYVCMLFAYMIW